MRPMVECPMPPLEERRRVVRERAIRVCKMMRDLPEERRTRALRMIVRLVEMRDELHRSDLAFRRACAESARVVGEVGQSAKRRRKLVAEWWWRVASWCRQEEAES